MHSSGGSVHSGRVFPVGGRRRNGLPKDRGPTEPHTQLLGGTQVLMLGKCCWQSRLAART